MPEFVDREFKNETVVLDGNVFRNCSFRDVVFQFSGKGVEMSNCNMDRFSFQFGGDLAAGLFTLHQLFGTDTMLKILRGFTEPHEGEVLI